MEGRDSGSVQGGGESGTIKILDFFTKNGPGGGASQGRLDPWDPSSFSPVVAFVIFLDHLATFATVYSNIKINKFQGNRMDLRPCGGTLY